MILRFSPSAVVSLRQRCSKALVKKALKKGMLIGIDADLDEGETKHFVQSIAMHCLILEYLTPRNESLYRSI